MHNRLTWLALSRAVLLPGLCLLLASLAPRMVQAQSGLEMDVHAERVMIRGLSWLQNGYPDRAVAVFSEGLKVHPGNPALLGAMAQAQAAWGDLGTARFYLDQALTLSPSRPELVSQDLDLALASGDPQASQRAVDRLLALEGVEPALLLRHLSDLMARGSAALSLQLASRSLSWFPDNVTILEQAVSTMAAAGNLEQAASAAGRLAGLTGTWDHALQLARLQMQLGRWPEASETLVPLVRLDPDDATAAAMLADLDARIPDRFLLSEAGLPGLPTGAADVSAAPTDSLGLLRSAWVAAPDAEQPALVLIRFLTVHDQAREAALLATEHVDAFPRHLDVWVEGTRAWMVAKEAARAVDMAETARLLFPGFPPVELVYAESLAASGQSDDALLHLEGLLARWEPGSADHAAATALRARIRRLP
ncbi:MAG: tetratricopeptide repeat protein [Bacteroidetes bacterium]|nr:tetratricopeptide repeat protein [Bacteroidota bacterium]